MSADTGHMLVGLFLIACSLILLAVVYKAWKSGIVKGRFGIVLYRRRSEPAGYWSMLTLYGLLGAVVFVTGVAWLIGDIR